MILEPALLSLFCLKISAERTRVVIISHVISSPYKFLSELMMREYGAVNCNKCGAGWPSFPRLHCSQCPFNSQVRDNCN